MIQGGRVTSTLGICQPLPIDLQPPSRQTIAEAIVQTIAIARAQKGCRVDSAPFQSTIE
jgi:hypothetical protein